MSLPIPLLLAAALTTLGAAATATACPPPPPPLPTPQERARSFWNRVDEVCIVRLDRATLAASDLPALQKIALAQGRWQVIAWIHERLNGACAPGTVHFADVPYALCRGGMPAFDQVLLVGLTRERVMIQWMAPDGPVADAIRVLATEHHNQPQGEPTPWKATQ
jgi:hypothetical protein